MADGHRMGTGPERLLARRSPAVAGVGEVLAEEPQVDLVAPDRGRCEVPFPTQRQGPLLDMARPPTPRVLVGERQEPPHQSHARLNRVHLQTAGALLGPPTAQHRLEHGVFGSQLRHPRDQLEAGRSHQITTSQIDLQPVPSSGMIMHLTGVPMADTRSGHVQSPTGRPIPSPRSAGDLEFYSRLMQFPRVGVDACRLDPLVTQP
jgi:hypothetical protein